MIKSLDTSKLAELTSVLTRVLKCGWGNKKLFEILCGYEFEPHGVASESWDIIWRLNIHRIPHHWKNNKNEWVKGTTMNGIEFEDRRADGVINKALSFLHEAEKQGIKLGDFSFSED